MLYHRELGFRGKGALEAEETAQTPVAARVPRSAAAALLRIGGTCLVPRAHEPRGRSCPCPLHCRTPCSLLSRARSTLPCPPVRPRHVSLLLTITNARSCPDRPAKTRVLKEMIFPNCERLGQTIIFVRTRDTAKALHAGESDTRTCSQSVLSGLCRRYSQTSQTCARTYASSGCSLPRLPVRYYATVFRMDPYPLGGIA